ncbi:MAG: hypothetical protein D6B25_06490 [Desulfobulbaceae bacterium]|nr:MAG: hypothetical protein D6B25_06490 [Desulfobulbaceae bacterium]
MMIKKSICPLDCPDSCGIVAKVENGRVVSVAGDPDHPYTNGFICRKMKRYPERLYSNKRILYPQIRDGKKGAGKFRRVSWDEAWDYLIPRFREILDTHGGQAILPFSYAGNMGAVNRFAGFPLFHRMGTLQTHQTICSATANGAWKMHCGEGGGRPPRVAADADLIIAWGINIRVSNVHFWQYVKQARTKGAKLVVIDPYQNDTARLADHYLRVKPGGDSALALGVAKILADREWLNHPFIEQQTDGYTTFADYLTTLTYEELEQESGVDFTQMQMLAELLYHNEKTFLRIGVGLSRNSKGGMSVRAICSLAATRGLFSGGKGRGVLLFTGAFSGDKTILTAPELAPAQLHTINMIHLAEALSEHHGVKALVVYNANPVNVVPDTSSVRKNLEREDLFTLVHEQVMTPTARYADVLLPATTFLENRDIYSAYGHFYLGVADRVIEPYKEARSNFDFFQEFARRMGYEDAPFSEDLDSRLQRYLLSIKELPEGFDQELYQDGTYVESIHQQQDRGQLERNGARFQFVNRDDPSQPPHACLVRSREWENPDLAARFPYLLITPPNDRLLNSTFGELYEDQTGTVLINPFDAEKEGVSQGEEISLENFRGRVRRSVVITDSVDAGLLVAEGIYWGPDQECGAINDLVSQVASDVGGGPIFHEIRVALKKD